ncbi:response regulator [Rhizobium sp. AB2/73]|uniref:response regulator n=1 Tax=Rhizobium sp. AB2/73 TaxID=2795216 RepID=UPI000DDCCB4D|nr:response regulator [Rhizobium sp. AB2/73]QYA16412.1 response regulator [Rhizobium sp. AB2/73]UEQ84955.1 response regulator [Rhizobium sp. AB2/73]
MNDPTPAYSKMFSGKRLLIVEDDYFLTERTSRKLCSLGAILIGPMTDVPHALDLIEGDRVDAAIIDIRLDPDLAYAMAEALEEVGLPYVFAIADNPPPQFSGFVLREKVDDIEHIATALFGARRLDV